MKGVSAAGAGPVTLSLEEWVWEYTLLEYVGFEGVVVVSFLCLLYSDLCMKLGYCGEWEFTYILSLLFPHSLCIQAHTSI